MRESALNKEAKIHRLLNQRRIAFTLIERTRTLLRPGVPFTRELHELFRSQGKFGSRDRRLYRELIYTYIRFQPWLEAVQKEEKRLLDQLILLASPTNEIQSLYPTLTDRQESLFPEMERYKSIGRETHELRNLFPDWFFKHTDRLVSEKSLQTYLSRPPLWLRIQKGSANEIIEELRKAAGPKLAEKVTMHPLVPDCIHAPADLSIAELPCYTGGLVEIQDISSQLLLQLPIELPSGNWLDACAGAGGKTLQLAKLLENRGMVHAYDPRPSALRELKARAARSSFENIEVLQFRPTSGSYEGVLVDAPCSGSGTWRRHPYLIRQTRESDIFDYAEKQLSILKIYAPRVTKGGMLLYATCSLSKFENEQVAQQFLATNPEFSHHALVPRFGYLDRGKGITIYPEDHNGDGLYLCAFRRG